MFPPSFTQRHTKYPALSQVLSATADKQTNIQSLSQHYPEESDDETGTATNTNTTDPSSTPPVQPVENRPPPPQSPDESKTAEKPPVQTESPQRPPINNHQSPANEANESIASPKKRSTEEGGGDPKQGGDTGRGMYQPHCLYCYLTS